MKANREHEPACCSLVLKTLKNNPHKQQKPNQEQQAKQAPSQPKCCEELPHRWRRSSLQCEAMQEKQVKNRASKIVTKKRKNKTTRKPEILEDVCIRPCTPTQTTLSSASKQAASAEQIATEEQDRCFATDNHEPQDVELHT